MLYPLFAYTYLELLQAGERAHAGDFFERFHSDHALAHRPELNLLSQVGRVAFDSDCVHWRRDAESRRSILHPSRPRMEGTSGVSHLAQSWRR